MKKTGSTPWYRRQHRYCVLLCMRDSIEEALACKLGVSH